MEKYRENKMVTYFSLRIPIVKYTTGSYCVKSARNHVLIWSLSSDANVNCVIKMGHLASIAEHGSL